jgi:hypothetical protein
MRSERVRVIGVISAVIALIGAVFFGWDFSGSTQFIPFAIGILVAIFTISIVVRNVIMSG